MHLVYSLVSLALAGSALAAPTNNNQKPATTCGKVGVVGNGITYDGPYTGKYSTLSECSQDAQYAGYQSWSFHHFDNSCTFYHQPVSGLNLGSGGDEQVFYDTACGDYTNATCGVQISANADNTLRAGQQYAIEKLEDWNMCVMQCTEKPNCYAIAIDHVENECILYSQTTSFIKSISPSLDSGKNAVQMYDLYCFIPQTDPLYMQG